MSSGGFAFFHLNRLSDPHQNQQEKKHLTKENHQFSICQEKRHKSKILIFCMLNILVLGLHSCWGYKVLD